MKSGKHGLADAKGFTMIEVLIVMVILAIGVLGVASLQIASVHNNSLGNLITQATMLAQEKMETLKSTSAVTLLTDGLESNIDQYGDAGGNFSRSWTISNPLGGISSRQIEVRVQWSKGGVDRQVMLNAITRGGGV